MLALQLASNAWAQTVQDFDAPGTLYVLKACASGTAAAVKTGGPTGSFLRLASIPATPANANTVTFDRTNSGAFTLVVADFDFRVKPAGKQTGGRADGFNFTLLNTGSFGTAGALCPELSPFTAEEPNFTASLGIGFDIYRSCPPDNPTCDVDIDNHYDINSSNNHISVHFNGQRLTQVDIALRTMDLAGGHWIHARILIRKRNERPFSDVSVILTPRGGQPVGVLDAFEVAGMVPYEGRAHFGARSGGESADHDLDNIHVQFSDLSQSLLSFSSVSYTALETDSAATLSVVRTGNTGGAVNVRYDTADLTATAGADYTASTGILTFGPGETSKTFSIPILNDDATENADETFQVRLSDPGGGALLTGPSTATVHLVDEETARLFGHWSDVLIWPFVAIHMALLPTGNVIFWENKGQHDEVALWNPSTGLISSPSLPGHDIFCTGHSFLADGKLFVSGGHIHDNEGLAHAVFYDPFNNTWSEAPEMNAGRWYPTNTALGNGDVLVISGDIQLNLRNLLPQVWQAESNTWRDLSGAQSPAANGVGLYPKMFLAPNGKVFKAGVDRDTWLLDVSGVGAWIAGPLANYAPPRTEGPAVIRDGKVFVFGGGDPPTDTNEAFDLNLANPALIQAPPPMTRPRHHNNATLLPDGKILITGGTSSPGFNNAAGAVLEPELYDPDTNTRAPLGAMKVNRLYHSTALLLPDGRVLTAGGGMDPAIGDYDHRDAEIFSPPYLFNGPRPTITAAPNSTAIGDTFLVQTPDATNIARASLIRLGAVTHSLDQNQRYVSLPFSLVVGGLQLTVPSNPSVCPPGHYMFFLVSRSGVPSVAKIIQVTTVTSILKIKISQATYVNGEAVTVTEFRLENPGSTESKIELAVWLEVPGIEPISFLNLGAGGSFILPPNFSQNSGPLTLFTVTTSFPRGSYAINSRMVNPVTKKFLSEDINPFLIQ